MAAPPPQLSDLDPAWVAQDKGPSVITSIVAVTVLETLFAGARLYVRGKIMRKLQLDDYLIIAAVLCGWAAVAFGVLAANSGNGKHFIVLTPEQQSGSILWTIAGFCPGIFSFGLPKLAVIHLLTRLMNTGRKHKIFLWAMGILTNLSLVGCVVILFAQCTPVESQWNFALMPTAKCWSKWVLVNFAIFAGVMCAVTDLYLAIYPAVVLFNLSITIRKKIALTGALGIGSIASVVAIYKTTCLPSLASDDFTYNTADLVIWTCVEGSTIIIASSIPLLQPLVDKVIGTGLFSSGHNRGTYKNYGTSRNGPLKSDHELSYQARKRTVQDPNSLTFLEKAGSEESILGGNGSQVKRSPSVSTKGISPHSTPHGHGITRTDEVLITRTSVSQQTVEGGFHDQERRQF